jgi:hypothetical protein
MDNPGSEGLSIMRRLRHFMGGFKEPEMVGQRQEDHLRLQVPKPLALFIFMGILV